MPGRNFIGFVKSCHQNAMEDIKRQQQGVEEPLPPERVELDDSEEEADVEGKDFVMIEEEPEKLPCQALYEAMIKNKKKKRIKKRLEDSIDRLNSMKL